MALAEPPWPLNEIERVGKLKDLGILDTPADPAFDRLTRLAARHFHVPIALVSLVDEGRQWFKSRCGLDVPQTSRRLSFCAHTILENRVMVVADTFHDERFSENELVTGPPHIRFYAGAPLNAPGGLLLGTFCIIDRCPHQSFDLSAEQDLEAFSSIAMHEIDTLAARRAERKARAAAEHAEARLRAIVDTAVDAMVVIDETGQIQSFNPASQTMFGYEPSEAIGENVRMLMSDPDRLKHDDYIANYRRTGERKIIGVGRKVQGRRKDGKVFPLELAIAEWKVEGQRFFTGIMRDITERKRAEDNLCAAKAEADRANIAKSKFLAAASHDLRQPVQSLLLFMGVLRNCLEGTPNISTLDVMDQALSGLCALLDGILDISRLDAGLVTARPVSLPVWTILERLAREYEPRAAAKGLRLHATRCSAAIYTDPALLERVLRNLVENAIKYTDRGGILIGCRRRGNQLGIEVLDTGLGIPIELQEQVFEEFFQIGNQERDRAKGLGLGLAVVRRTARVLGHEVLIRSEPDRGSCFAVLVPLAQTATLIFQEQPVIMEAPTTGTILVVDDETTVRMGMEALLTGWGYRAFGAGSLNDAVSLLDVRPTPDAILADYRLRAGETGVDVIRAVQDRIGRPIPSAIITGDTAPERLAEAQAGGYRLLHKPVGAGQLRAAVADLMKTGADFSH